ncbi:MAG: hypothetical protein WBA24_03500, partial [Geitlerinemataceae cyanobacterium]
MPPRLSGFDPHTVALWVWVNPIDMSGWTAIHPDNFFENETVLVTEVNYPTLSGVPLQCGLVSELHRNSEN